jgi:hypothetical protein
MQCTHCTVYCAQRFSKEDIKEQPTSRNLSATATRVLQCTCPVAASRKYFRIFSPYRDSSGSEFRAQKKLESFLMFATKNSDTTSKCPG